MDYKFTIEELINNKDILLIEERLGESRDRFCTQMLIKKQQLVDDFIYKRLETNVLSAMKVKIENELLERRMKESKTNDN